MGIILSRFEKKKSTIEVLDHIDHEIQRLQGFKHENQKRQKWFMAKLLLYSILIYIIAALVVYFYYFPESWKQRLLYLIPLLLFPFMIWFTKNALGWYFVRRIAKNDLALEELAALKKEILENVMEKETYKKAKEILEKYDPDRFKELELPMKTPAHAKTPGTEIRQRHGEVRSPQSTQPQPDFTRAPLNMTSLRPSQAMGMTPYGQRNATQPRTLLNSSHANGWTPQGPPLPRPILSRDRGVVDKLLEYLTGDGPQNRYALICQNCFSHNGMAMKEEFEYLAFRCCYCFFLNPAKSKRPLAPRIEHKLITSVDFPVHERNLPSAKAIGTAQLTDDELENGDDNDDASQDDASTENVTDSHESEDEMKVDDNEATLTIKGTKDVMGVRRIFPESAKGSDAVETG